MLGDAPNQLDRLRDDVARRRPPTLLDVAVTPGDDHRGGRAHERLASALQYLERLAARHRRRGDRQPDGGRRDGRDLALAALAVAPPRAHRARGVERIIDEVMAELPDEQVYHEALEVFEKVALREVFVDFLTLTAYARLLGDESVERDEGRRLPSPRGASRPPPPPPLSPPSSPPPASPPLPPPHAYWRVGLVGPPTRSDLSTRSPPSRASRPSISAPA